MFLNLFYLINLRIYMEHKYIYTLIALTIIAVVTIVILKLTENRSSDKPNYS